MSAVGLAVVVLWTPIRAYTDRERARRRGLYRRIQAEYREMPGLSLTVAQAARLLGVSRDLCTRLLNELAKRGVLQAGERGYRLRGQLR
jgi:Fic family protein